MLFDPVYGSGIFRGGGFLTVTQTHFTHNFLSIVQDFFISGKSYNFELAQANFSDSYPLLSLGLIGFVIFGLAIKKKTYRLPILLSVGVILLTYIVVSMTSDPTSLYGMRRNTPILIGIYTLFILSWHFVTHKPWHSQVARRLVYGIFMMLFLHNLLVFPTNLSQLQNTSIYGYQLVPGQSPTDGLRTLVKQTRHHDLYLSCKKTDCRYQEIYAAVAGYCLWNKLSCHAIYGYNYQNGSNILLSPTVWDTYTLSH